MLLLLLFVELLFVCSLIVVDNDNVVIVMIGVCGVKRLKKKNKI